MSCLSCYFFLSYFFSIYAFLFQFQYKVELSHHTCNPLHTWLYGTWWFSFCFANGLLSNYLYLSLLTISFMLKFSSEFFISIITLFFKSSFSVWLYMSFLYLYQLYILFLLFPNLMLFLCFCISSHLLLLQCDIVGCQAINRKPFLWDELSFVDGSLTPPANLQL